MFAIKKLILITFFILSFSVLWSQERGMIKGLVYNQKDKTPLVSANVLNKTSFSGRITNSTGYFEIPASVGDTLIISYLGFKNYKLAVRPGDFDKIHEIYLVEQPVSLQEVLITGNRLTGILKTDLRLIPVRKKQKIDLKIKFYFGDTVPDLLTRINQDLRTIMDPVGMLYNLFSAHGKDLRKLRKMEQDDELIRILNSRFDRKIISDLLDIPPEQVYRILELCEYDKDFLLNASDFQILEALRSCYEKHRVLIKQSE